MFSHSGSVLSEVQVEQCGQGECDFLCWYRYKDEYEPEENKVKYPQKEDRQYEGYMWLFTITEARRNGANVDIDTYQSDRLEWSDKYQKYVLQKHVFDNEEDYYKQFR